MKPEVARNRFIPHGIYMPSFSQLQARLKPEMRGFFDYVWKRYVETDKWPSVHDVYQNHLEKPALEKHRDRSTGAFVIVQGGHERTYELRILGILSTSDGAAYQEWLRRLFHHLRDTYYQPKPPTNVFSGEIARALEIDANATAILARILRTNIFNTYPVQSAGSPDWQIQIPLDLMADLPRKGSVDLQFLDRLNEQARFPLHVSPVKRVQPASAPAIFGLDEDDSIETNGERRYQVFVSSTFKDLIPERQHVMQALLESHCIPAGMELFPATNLEQWKLIQRVIDESDYYIVIVAGRYGDSPPRSKKSYTEREYDYALKRKKPILGFFHADPTSIPAKFCEDTSAARKRLERFTAKVKRRLCRSWRTPAELGSAVKSAIHDAIRDDPQRGWVRTPVNDEWNP